MVVVGDAIWLTPHGFVGAKLVAELELPSDWTGAHAGEELCGLYVGLRHGRELHHLITERSVKGRIVCNDFISQFVLVFLAFTSIWTMGSMGERCGCCCEVFPHLQSAARLCTSEFFTPTLSYSAWWITAITVAFYVVVSFAHFFVTLRPAEAKGHAPEGSPAPAGAK